MAKQREEEEDKQKLMELIKLKEREEQKLLEMKREVERQVEEERMRLE